MNSARIWKSIQRSSAGYLSDVSQCVEDYERKRPGCFPNLRDGTDVVVASDYSGEHKSVGFYAFSFVFVDWNASEQWSIASSTVRDKYLAVNNREMAYKKLGDWRKQAALIPFLAAADQIPGLAITLLEGVTSFNE